MFAATRVKTMFAAGRRCSLLLQKSSWTRIENVEHKFAVQALEKQIVPCLGASAEKCREYELNASNEVLRAHQSWFDLCFQNPSCGSYQNYSFPGDVKKNECDLYLKKADMKLKDLFKDCCVEAYHIVRSC